MLLELHIENLAVIARADLEFAPGLNVITGETGAGKTILAHAIALLLGVRAGSGLIRPGAEAASVEAVFEVPPGCFADLAGEIDLPHGELLAVRRRLGRDGRSRAWVGGRSATLSVLGQLTGRLLKFSAQHEQQRLMMASHQLELLDDFGGGPLVDLRDEYSLLDERRAGLLAEQARERQDGEAVRREAELLAFQVAEIESAGLAADEDEELEGERRRLQNASELRDAALAAAAALGMADCESSGAAGASPGMMEQLAAALARLEGAAGVDAALDAFTGRMRASLLDLEESGRAARDYAGSVATDPARLAEVEERLDLISQLKRKYGARDLNGAPAGGTLNDVLAWAESASNRLAAIAADDNQRSRLAEELAAVEEEARALAERLSAMRREAARELEESATAHMRELAFQDCGLEIRLGRQDTLGLRGADTVEFFVRLNPGMPAAPLKETVSGGELSRIMLAIKSVSARGEAATLVFDEIDAGIGGETGSAVGERLRMLAASAQVICITHLPQIACRAAGGSGGTVSAGAAGDTGGTGAHFSIIKESDGESTSTRVVRLAGDEIVDELCRMMGSRPDDGKARAHARKLLRN